MIRRDPILISYQVWRWLRLIAKAESPEEGMPGSKVTPDQVADEILRQAIRDRFPQMPEHEKEIDKLERKLIEALQQGKRK